MWPQAEGPVRSPCIGWINSIMRRFYIHMKTQNVRKQMFWMIPVVGDPGRFTQSLSGEIAGEQHLIFRCCRPLPVVLGAGRAGGARAGYPMLRNN